MKSIFVPWYNKTNSIKDQFMHKKETNHTLMNHNNVKIIIKLNWWHSINYEIKCHNYILVSWFRHFFHNYDFSIIFCHNLDLIYLIIITFCLINYIILTFFYLQLWLSMWISYLSPNYAFLSPNCVFFIS